MSNKRIEIGTRPLANPDAEAWILQGSRSDNGKATPYSARLTLYITPALRSRIKRTAFDRGITMAAMLRDVLEVTFPEVEP